MRRSGSDSWLPFTCPLELVGRVNVVDSTGQESAKRWCPMKLTRDSALCLNLALPWTLTAARMGLEVRVGVGVVFFVKVDVVVVLSPMRRPARVRLPHVVSGSSQSIVPVVVWWCCGDGSVGGGDSLVHASAGISTATQRGVHSTAIYNHRRGSPRTRERVYGLLPFPSDSWLTLSPPRELVWMEPVDDSIGWGLDDSTGR